MSLYNLVQIQIKAGSREVVWTLVQALTLLSATLWYTVYTLTKVREPKSQIRLPFQPKTNLFKKTLLFDCVFNWYKKMNDAQTFIMNFFVSPVEYPLSLSLTVPMCLTTLNTALETFSSPHHSSEINAFLPTWSLKIFEMTTGTLCSAPPWKAGRDRWAGGLFVSTSASP